MGNFRLVGRLHKNCPSCINFGGCSRCFSYYSVNPGFEGDLSVVNSSALQCLDSPWETFGTRIVEFIDAYKKTHSFLDNKNFCVTWVNSLLIHFPLVSSCEEGVKCHSSED